MSKINCPNCGAPIEKGKYKCAYCGTLYLDLSMINFDEQEPFFLTIKKNNMLITQKVMPQTVSFESTEDVVYATGGKNDSKLMSFITSRKLETNVQFIAIPYEEDGQHIVCEVIPEIK